jgi:hypothetical protein
VPKAVYLSVVIGIKADINASNTGLVKLADFLRFMQKR